MPNPYVVDASVVAKWFNRGKTDEREALVLRTAWIEGRIELLAPSLIVYEVCNSIWKNTKIDEDQALTLAKLAGRLRPTLLELGEAESSDSMVLARERKLTSYDALYIVLSRSRGCPLISADGDQLEAARGYTKPIHIGEIRNFV